MQREPARQGAGSKLLANFILQWVNSEPKGIDVSITGQTA